MVVQGSPTKVVKETKEETEINPKETNQAESQDSDTEFTVETEELEELEESSSESENEDEIEAVEENFTIEVQNGEAKKLKFPQQNEVDTQDGETQEAETQESTGVEALEHTMDDEDDENDQDFNPCHDTLSDIEVNEDDEMAESDPEIEEEKGTHKKSGAAHQRIKVKNPMDVPPTDFENKAAESQEVEMEEQPSDSKMEE